MLITLSEYDTPTFVDECPVCGADKLQMCSIPDPDDEALGVELVNQVHSERIVDM